ncbi:MAG: ammonium transporter, partial [candidate division NC10 bacterium]|nr:ammonium transporter [candidate division NC10 bacterium]
MAHWRKRMRGLVILWSLAALLWGTGAALAAEEPAKDAPPAAAATTGPSTAGPATAAPAPAFTKEMADAIKDQKVAMDTIWVLVTAFLVFFMNLGFAMVESGLCQAKNTVNILSKNFIVFAISSLAFLILGWGLMFGDGNPFFGTQGLLFVTGADNSPAMGDAYKGVYSAINWTGVPLWAKFFFQLVFAGTAATIVSGAVAERIHFRAFIIFSFVMVGVIYPVVGHWIWGGGWLAKLGMFDFAGSTQVHSIGGWAALAGAILLGPRLGKYTKEGRVNPIPGHNMTAATIGTFVLWFGWFGFNPGSTMAADWAAIARIATTTNTAAAAAAFSATLTAWWLLGKPDLSMTLNGCLAGLVAITAPCAFVSVPSSLIIGLIAGVLVVGAVLFFDKIKVDDPVGAISVHLVCGVFGTLAVGLFAQDLLPNTTGNGLFFGGGMKLLIAQIVGIVGAGVFTFAVSLVVWGVLKATIGIRVSPEEEMEGLDIGEHGITAYPDFQVASTLRTPGAARVSGAEAVVPEPSFVRAKV